MSRHKGFIDRALAATADRWEPVRAAYGWVHQAAHILGAEGMPGPAVRARLGGMLGAMQRHRAAVGGLGAAVEHFVTGTRSDWPGLFHCYGTADLPRTNNDLEQLFGSHRYDERRATGRKGASPALVLRGSARRIAGLATRTREVTAADLAGADRDEWKRLRGELEERRQRRVDRHRFRRDPDGYLRGVEAKLSQSGLLP